MCVLDTKLVLERSCDAESDSVAHMIDVWNGVLASALSRKSSGSLESSDRQMNKMQEEQQRDGGQNTADERDKASETDATRQSKHRS